MKKKFLWGCGGCTSIISILVVIFIIWLWNLLGIPSISQINWGYQQTPVMLQTVNEFYKHYNNQEFDYIYDHMLSDKTKVKTSREKFMGYIVPFYQKMGKFKKTIDNKPFELDQYAL